MVFKFNNQLDNKETNEETKEQRKHKLMSGLNKIVALGILELAVITTFGTDMNYTFRPNELSSISQAKEESSEKNADKTTFSSDSQYFETEK